MAITIKKKSIPGAIGSFPKEFKGSFVSDGVLPASTTLTAAAAQNALSVTVASAVGFASRTAVEIAGAGNAGGTLPLEILLTGVAGSVLSFADKIKASAGIAIGAAVKAMTSLPVPFVPRKVILQNITDGVTWEWSDGMANNTAIKTVWSTGIRSHEATNGIFVCMTSINMPQSMLGINKSFTFDIQG